MENRELLLKLEDLCHLDIDAIGAYDAAIKHLRSPEVSSKLSEFRVDHVRHVQDLNALIVRLGGKAIAQNADLKGALLKGFTSLSSMAGNEAALLAMVGNEQLTNRKYEAALKLDFDAEVRSVLEKNYQDEKRHLAWIRQTASDRPWIKHEAEAHP